MWYITVGGKARIDQLWRALGALIVVVREGVRPPFIMINGEIRISKYNFDHVIYEADVAIDVKNALRGYYPRIIVEDSTSPRSIRLRYHELKALGMPVKFLLVDYKPTGIWSFKLSETPDISDLYMLEVSI